MKLKIEKLKKNHINAVCDILRRNLSDYKPQKKMLNSFVFIWKQFEKRTFYNYIFIK